MPSLARAASGRRDDSPTETDTRKTKEDFALPASVGDRVEIQFLVDHKGLKHFDTTTLDYHGYTLHEEPHISSSTFDMPGLASATGLRAYLRQNLQPSQIVDEYKVERDLSEISFDHLAVLQARLWTKVFDARSQDKSTAQRLAKREVLVTGHIAKISQLLEGKQQSTAL